MHPKALLDACAELVALTLKFDHPADSIVSRYFRYHRSLGPRERATLAGHQAIVAVRDAKPRSVTASGTVIYRSTPPMTGSIEATAAMASAMRLPSHMAEAA